MNPQNIKVFNPQYHILKVTKFLCKISQFEFLVITTKNIFAYKLFLSLNISDFNLLCDNCTPTHWRKSPPLSQQPPLKVVVLSSLPFFKFGWRLNTPPLPPPQPAPAERGAHYVTLTEADKLRQTES